MKKNSNSNHSPLSASFTRSVVDVGSVHDMVRRPGNLVGLINDRHMGDLSRFVGRRQTKSVFPGMRK